MFAPCLYVAANATFLETLAGVRVDEK